MHGYVPIEYPKWVGGVTVQNEADERARRKVLEAKALTGTVQATAALSRNTVEQLSIETVRARILELLTSERVALTETTMGSPAAKLARPTSPAAERMRLARQRRRDGLGVIPFEIRDKEISSSYSLDLLQKSEFDENSSIKSMGHRSQN